MSRDDSHPPEGREATASTTGRRPYRTPPGYRAGTGLDDPCPDARPLRILVMDPTGARAGYCHGLCNALSERGSDVELVSSPAWTRSVGRCPTRRYRARLEFGRSRGRSGWRRSRGRRRIRVPALVRAAVEKLGDAWTRARLLPETRRYDVVHVHQASFGLVDVFWLWLVCRWALAACTIHDLPSGHASRLSWRRLVNGAAYRTAGLLFVHSKAAGRALERDFRVSPSRIAHARYGSSAYLAELEQRAPPCPLAEKGTPVILFLGEIRTFDDMDVLLKAANHLRREVWDFKIVLAGRSGLDLAPYEDLTRDLALGRLVELRARNVEDDELAYYLRQATVVVLPHREVDQSGLAVTACTFGKPIVATRVGGVAELVEEAGNGVLVTPGSPRALALGLAKILRDPELRRRCETNSLIYARTDLAWRRIGPEMAVSYRRALSGR